MTDAKELIDDFIKTFDDKGLTHKNYRLGFSLGEAMLIQDAIEDQETEISQCIDKYEELEGWVLVSDRLPPETDEEVVFLIDNKHPETISGKLIGEFIADGLNVTAWKSLPPFPETQ